MFAMHATVAYAKISVSIEGGLCSETENAICFRHTYE